MTRKLNRAFTMMEIMVVVLLSMLVIVPAWRIFKSSSQSSLQGVHQIEMVMEGRRLLRQIHNDLKSACLPMENEVQIFTFYDLFNFHAPSQISQAGSSYDFLVFPMHAEIRDAVSEAITSGLSPRYVNRVIYRLEAQRDSPFLKLIREEKTHPGLRGGPAGAKVLTDKVNFFRIDAVPIQFPVAGGAKDQWFFNVTLQLAQAREPKDLTKVPSGNTIMNRTQGLIIADFYDVVYSEHFTAFWNQDFMGRNWHTVMDLPPAAPQ